ncbi:MAG: metal-dependent hydrolase [Gemmataceae bacterium]
MASFKGHMSLAVPLGVGYGALALLQKDYDWGTCALAAGLTSVGGAIPDLDSDSGVPVREMFGVLAAVSAFLAYHPLREHGMSLEQCVVIIAGVYFVVRYVLSNLFRRFTVHRGMFHSLPALLISGLAIYLTYPSRDIALRLFLAAGVMVGFLSHLILDEIYAVNISGIKIQFNQFAGSALKFFSPSVPATIATYLILFALGYIAWEGMPPWVKKPESWQAPAWMTGERNVARKPGAALDPKPLERPVQ